MAHATGLAMDVLVGGGGVRLGAAGLPVGLEGAAGVEVEVKVGTDGVRPGVSVAVAVPTDVVAEAVEDGDGAGGVGLGVLSSPSGKVPNRTVSGINICQLVRIVPCDPLYPPRLVAWKSPCPV
jgi:hypothetical protein